MVKCAISHPKKCLSLRKKIGKHVYTCSKYTKLRKLYTKKLLYLKSVVEMNFWMGGIFVCWKGAQIHSDEKVNMLLHPKQVSEVYK